MIRFRALLSIILFGCCIDGLFFVQSFSFKWDAQLNSISGKATSVENSSLSGEDLYSDTILKNVEREFMDYPQFLGRRKVLLGLFVAQKGEDGTNIRICDSLLGINLLTFGKIETKRFKFKEMNEKLGCTIANRGVTVKIPILGGLLACQRKTENKAVSNSGELHFQLTQSRSGDPQAQDFLQIETRIKDYESAISGKPPLNFFRKALYLNTQSLLHAYVMHRFHSHCYHISLSQKDSDKIQH